MKTTNATAEATAEDARDRARTTLLAEKVANWATAQAEATAQFEQWLADGHSLADAIEWHYDDAAAAAARAALWREALRAWAYYGPQHPGAPATLPEALEVCSQTAQPHGPAGQALRATVAGVARHVQATLLGSLPSQSTNPVANAMALVRHATYQREWRDGLHLFV